MDRLSDKYRFYMEETDLDIVEEYQIPNKNTPLHLLSSEFVFDGALEIVQNLELLQQRLWPENHYRELNIIYKGEKNADKMKKSLEKHRRKLTEIAQAYIEDDADNYIVQKSREAFQAIMDYFDGILEADRIHTLIEPAIMIQRMLSKAREIFDNHIHVDSYEYPTLDRAISIREAARLQTFPDSFVFCGSKDKQYQQVGNAVPPIMAKAIAKQLAATLGKKLREAEQENVV